MNKKILLMVICFTGVNSVLFAQNWQVGGNGNASVPAAGGEFGTKGDRVVIFETNNTERARMLNGNGRFGFGTNAPNTRVHINSDLTLFPGENPFRVQVNGASKLYVDNGGGVSVGSALIPPANGLFVSGSAGIGTPSPQTKLHVTGGSDAAPGGGGFITTGTLTSTNIALDDNEIMARNNGAVADFFINHNGGNVFLNDVGSGGLSIGTTTAPPTKGLRVQGNIVGSGNIDVTGTVGFGSVETFSDGGSFTIQSNSDIVPDADNSNNLGTTARTWATVHAGSYLNLTSAKALSTAENLKAGLPEIMKLRPVSYTDGAVKKIGLVGTEVQSVLPEATSDQDLLSNEDGVRSLTKTEKVALEYDALIPLLIKGMQEQQKMIVALQNRMAKLEAASSVAASGNDNVSANNLHSGAALEQNQPNPFNQSTIIRYRFPQNASGQINIYDNNGKLLKSYKANESGQTTINAGALKSGVYNYTLLVNGKQVDTKKLVIAK